MGNRLTGAQHATFGPTAWALSLDGLTAAQVAGEINRRYGSGITEKAVDRLIKTQIARYAEQHQDEVAVARVRHESRQEWVLGQCKEGADSPEVSHGERVAYLRLFSKASADIGKAAGIFVERVDIHQQTEVLVREYIGINVEAV